ISFDGWVLHVPPLDPVEQDVQRGRQVMQLDGGAKRSGSAPQAIPFGSRPSTPFDNYGQATTKELPTELPLQSFDFCAPLLVIDIQRKSLHPFVWTEANGSEPGFKQLSVRCLP